ncbi:hypothetical protein M2202_005195 [Bradyrhizobium japonicum]|nr:hypothetical protein [Bradyrhizobium japonicum]MCP1788132.1 hypothetical protein [Bradyrhizobium japonicum]MCP1810008.1 hypothetical protein [Bradyrhizobium japonicum]MCP1818942.1 hypothetical protein [Bradyrhizobium japonicum]MCP1869548.1 hypothetical protein [Bradyrhizobium japonicum]
MIGEAVAWVTHVECPHQRIARDLGQNGSGSDARGFGVSFDDRLLRDRDIFKAFRVDQEMLRGEPKPFNSPPHCEDTGPVDVDGVDFLDFDKGDRP